ncbi:MAG: sulfite exporter TauE/SafE family protein [Candidatus Omnitrophota bacterium]|nr:MAG: sulfite exporter TauE/SafE family protein [Candidatus Omnitrophota bacterium]
MEEAMSIYFCLTLGLIAGIFSGFLGIGGGTIIIPALVYLLGFTQHQAQGTTLALMVPPIGLLAAIKYYQAGNADIKVAALICVGFFIGGLIGASFVTPIPDALLKKIFGAFLIGVALKMILGK